MSRKRKPATKASPSSAKSKPRSAKESKPTPDALARPRQPSARRDTPRDTPAVVAERAARRRDTPVEAPVIDETAAGAASSGPERRSAALARSEPRAPVPQSAAPVRSARRVTEAALARIGAIESLENAYEAWLDLKLEHAAFLLRCEEERRKLDQQGSFLVGAVRAAASDASAAPAREAAVSALARDEGATADLQRFLREAEEKIGASRQRLEQELVSETRLYEDAFARIRAELEGRVSRMAAASPPRVQLLMRPVGASRTVLHLERVTPDAAILLMYALSGRIPTRYGYLFDDSTDDVMQAPQPLYADEGLAPAQTRPSPAELRAYVEANPKLVAAKGFIPVFVPRPAGGEDFFRLLQRGPVMEVELLEGGELKSILDREQGERFAGHLLRLKLARRIELELDAG